jgi:uncharacterized protein YjhX (UPF0386 family)
LFRRIIERDRDQNRARERLIRISRCDHTADAGQTIAEINCVRRRGCNCELEFKDVDIEVEDGLPRPPDLDTGIAG